MVAPAGGMVGGVFALAGCLKREHGSSRAFVGLSEFAVARLVLAEQRRRETATTKSSALARHLYIKNVGH